MIKITIMKEIPFESEFILHTLTQNFLKELFDLEFIKSEIQLNDLRLDNLAFDPKTNSFVVIEYKNEFNANVLNQTQEYYNLIQDNKEFFIDLLDETRDVDFKNVRVMIIGPEFSQNQIENHAPHFELWKTTLFEDGKVSYQNLENGEIKTITINLDDLKLTEELLLRDKTPEMKELYFNLKNKVLTEFSDVDIKYLIDQFSFRVNDKLICVVIFLKSSFNVHYYGDNLKNADRTKDISKKSTGGNANYNLKYKSDDDFDYFINLFTQTYNQKRD